MTLPYGSFRYYRSEESFAIRNYENRLIAIICFLLTWNKINQLKAAVHIQFFADAVYEV